MVLWIYALGTIVRIKTTGAIAEVKCRYGNETPIQYEVWTYDEKKEIVTAIFDHEMLEVEWAPPEYLPSERLKDLRTYAEIIVNVQFENPKIRGAMGSRLKREY
jgi:hypothetical protein